LLNTNENLQVLIGFRNFMKNVLFHDEYL